VASGIGVASIKGIDHRETPKQVMNLKDGQLN